MSLIAGQSMLRTDDGMKGTVIMTEGDILRISYLDRGEERFAGKGEKWEPIRPPPRKLRQEEMEHVARFADCALSAVESHAPMQWWLVDSVGRKRSPYDQGLIDVIVAYLEKRA